VCVICASLLLASLADMQVASWGPGLNNRIGITISEIRLPVRPNDNGQLQVCEALL